MADEGTKRIAGASRPEQKKSDVIPYQSAAVVQILRLDQADWIAFAAQYRLSAINM